jgi:hypothetical protein
MQLTSIREPSVRAEGLPLQDGPVRRLVSAICALAALLLIAASMGMNYVFWSGQGADEWTGRVLGAVSIGIDGFKAALPLIIAWAAADAEPRRRIGRRTGRTEVYFVRVREGYKGEMLGYQAELQLERKKIGGRVRKVTEGEVVELILETFKVVRRNGDAVGYAVPIPNVVWQGLHEIARRLQCSSAEALEQLVVQKIDELGLLQRK